MHHAVRSRSIEIIGRRGSGGSSIQDEDGTGGEETTGPDDAALLSRSLPIAIPDGRPVLRKAADSSDSLDEPSTVKVR